MIRLILCVLFVVVFLLCSIPLYLVVLLVGLFNRRARDVLSLRLVQWAFQVVGFLAGAKVTYVGEENIPKKQAVLYVANHRSFFDIILTYKNCPDLTGYISKKEIKKVPLLNIWMLFLYCLFLDRSDIKAGLATIKQAIQRVQSGISICIFPEGTRNKEEGTLLPFKEGSLRIAAKSGCPVIPMVIQGSAAIWEDHMPFVRPGRVTVTYGTPFYIKDLPEEDRKHPAAYTQRIMQEMLDKGKAEQERTD
jgi:1-acyl-sn-glycerol-3-phosphate acyltransferase